MDVRRQVFGENIRIVFSLVLSNPQQIHFSINIREEHRTDQVEMVLERPNSGTERGMAECGMEFHLIQENTNL